MATEKIGNTKRTGLRVAGGVVALTLGGLLLAPQSGWLVRAQLKGAVGSALFASQTTSSVLARRAQKAARIAADPLNQNNFGLQMAAAEAQATVEPTPNNDFISTGSNLTRALSPLLHSYKNSPALHATILRYLSQDAVHIMDRPEISLLKNESPETFAKKYAEKNDGKMNRPEALAAWETSASAGERLDPDNAYFSVMQAIGLFAAHKDNEANAALLRASTKTRYEEYLTDEIEGQWRLNEQLQGKSGYIAELAVSAAQLYPHYSQERQAARLAMVGALRAEMAGDTESGYQTRMALTRIGAMMGTDSKPIIGGLVGRAIELLAWTRPGGALPLPPLRDAGDGAAQNKRAQENLDRYCAYLSQIGHGDAAAEVRYDYQASENYRGLWRRAENLPDNVMELQAMYRLMAWWAVGAGILTNLFVLLIAGGLCALLARAPRLRAGTPLLPAARAGVVSAVVLPAFGLSVALSWPEPLSLALLLAGAFTAALLILRTVRRRTSNAATAHTTAAHEAAATAPQAAVPFWKSPDVHDYLGSMGVTVLGITALGLLSFIGPMQMVNGTDVFLGLRPAEEVDFTKLFLRTVTWAGASCGVSLLLLFGLAIGSRVRRIPASVGMVRGMRRAALPVAALLVFGYSGVVVATLNEETRATQAMRTCVHEGEAAYLAGLLHETPPVRYAAAPASTLRPFTVTNGYNGPLSGITGKGKTAK